MYSMVLMAALTTGTATGQFGYYGLGDYGWGGWGWGGSGLGWGGYGLGWGGYGLGWGNNGWGWDGWGYGGYPLIGGYAYSPMVSGWGWGAPAFSAGAILNPGLARSFYNSPAAAIPARANPANEARLIVNLPPQATLTIDDYPTMSRSEQRVFVTPPLEPGKTYTYTLRAEMNRDGRFVRETKTVEVKAGQVSEVTVRFGDTSREEIGAPTPNAPPSNR
jgi:uncharacterized protein (TIGR03000 family)